MDTFFITFWLTLLCLVLAEGGKEKVFASRTQIHLTGPLAQGFDPATPKEDTTGFDRATPIEATKLDDITKEGIANITPNSHTTAASTTGSYTSQIEAPEALNNYATTTESTSQTEANPNGPSDETHSPIAMTAVNPNQLSSTEKSRNEKIHAGANVSSHVAKFNGNNNVYSDEASDGDTTDHLPSTMNLRNKNSATLTNKSTLTEEKMANSSLNRAIDSLCVSGLILAHIWISYLVYAIIIGLLAIVAKELYSARIRRCQIGLELNPVA